MKAKHSILLALLATLVFACSATKNNNTTSLYNTAWELEYISGTRIAFNGLYPNKKPQITFNQSTNTVSGNNGCNGYSAPFAIKDNTITFGQPGPATLMFCEGGGEQQFLTTIKKVNRYAFDANGKLLLLIDDIPFMRFHKTNTP